MVERLKMAGEGTLSPEVGSTATLSAPTPKEVKPAEQEPLSAEGAIAEAESIIRESKQNIIPALPREGGIVQPEAADAPFNPPAVNFPDTTNSQLQDQTDTRGTTTQADADGTGRGDGGRRGDGGGRGSEGPPPPDRNSLEYESSPERGREIAEEIIPWEALRVVGRYNEVNWPVLNQLYREQRIHTVAQRKVALHVKFFEPEEESTSNIEHPKRVNPDYFLGCSKTLKEWIDEYKTNPDIVFDPKFIDDIDVYFKEAKDINLLKDLDAVLATIYNRDVIPGIKRNLRVNQIMSGTRGRGVEGVNDKITAELEAVRGVYEDRRWTDRNIGLLEGVWELYSAFAQQRFIAAINNRDTEGVTQRPYVIDNEFHLGLDEADDASEETYWRTTWGTYVEVYAQTE